MTSKWERVPVSEACELIVDCVNKTAPTVDYETSYKMIRTTNIRNGRLDLSTTKFVTEDTYIKWTRRATVEPDDVLLTREAPLGEVGRVREKDTIFLGQRIMQYRADKKVLDPRFLFYSFCSKELQNQFHAHGGSGSVVDHIRVGDCHKFLIPLPPLDEQKAIAHILGTLDDKIELNQQMNRTLEAIQWTLFKSWFTENGFPDDWQLLLLEECMEAIIDYRGKTPKKTESGIPLITAKIVKGGRISPPQEFIAPEDYDSWMRRGIPEHGDVVMTTEAPLGEIAKLSGKKVALAQRLITLRGKSGLLDNTYLKFLMQSSFVQDQLHARASGSTVLGIKQSELRQITFPVPSFLEQEQMMAPLKVLEDKIDANEEESLTLSKMRDALLPKLLSGEIRIKNAEKVVEAVA